MNISVSGQDRTKDLGAGIVAEGVRLKAGGSIGSLAPEHSALRLKESADPDEYSDRFIDLLRMRHGVRTTDYYIPRGPGLRGQAALALKTVLWKLLRYQHDRLTLQQNLINELEIQAQAFRQERVDRELADLRARIGRLERNRPDGGGS